MSVSIIQNLLRNYLSFGFVFLLMPFLGTSVYAIEPFPKNNLKDIDSLPFLGINKSFGRWENGTIPIAYNPNGAPSGKSINEMESLFRSSFGILENIADIHFDYQGTTTADNTNYVDSIVVIAWDQLDGGLAGIASPRLGAYQSSDLHRLGYWPYLDGRVVLSTLVSTDQITQRVIIHELIHLLGLGHSENPISIMNTNYSFFHLPQTDDIQALQAMYGPPDQFVKPVNSVTWDATPIGPSIELLSSEAGFNVNVQYDNVIGYISQVDSSLNTDNQISFRIHYRGISLGSMATKYITDPHGNVTSEDPFTISFENGWINFSVGTVERMLSQPGHWTVEIGLDGSLLTSDTIEVVGDEPIYNHTPVVTLSSVYDRQKRFTLNLDIDDPEGDIETVAWHVPNNVSRVIRDGNTLIVDLNQGQPSVSQIFGGVSDEKLRPGDDDERKGPGAGFGGLVSRYLVMPAKTGVPTYFVNEQLLHIPDLEIEGGLFSLNFKLTKLDDISLKFIEFDQLSNIAPSGNASLDLATGELLLSRLIVVENSQESEINNVRFSLVPNSDPIRIKLEL